jgi:hypothetical protein
LRRLTGEGDAITLRGGVADAATEGHLLTELVVDAAAIEEVEDAITAAEYGLARPEGVVGEADAGSEVTVVGVDDATRNAVDAGELDGAGSGVEGRLAVVLLGGEGDEVVAEAEVKG